MRLTRRLVVDRLHHRLPVLLPAAAGDVRLLARQSARRRRRAALARVLRQRPGRTRSGFWSQPRLLVRHRHHHDRREHRLLLPTAFWVRLRVPRARPFVEFITLLPFVIPPIVLVFGLISTFSHPPLPFTYTDIGSSALLIVRLCRPVVPVHVPGDRHRPPVDRHPLADRSGPEPRRRLAADHRRRSSCRTSASPCCPAPS